MNEFETVCFDVGHRGRAEMFQRMAGTGYRLPIDIAGYNGLIKVISVTDMSSPNIQRWHVRGVPVNKKVASWFDGRLNVSTRDRLVGKAAEGFWRDRISGFLNLGREGFAGTAFVTDLEVKADCHGTEWNFVLECKERRSHERLNQEMFLNEHRIRCLPINFLDKFPINFLDKFPINFLDKESDMKVFEGVVLAVNDKGEVAELKKIVPPFLSKSLTTAEAAVRIDYAIANKLSGEDAAALQVRVREFLGGNTLGY